ncbi:hypothetical protein [Corallococcus exercitus]|uniref:hypothetical protein n=1 Tax=Corallococcus exercitus TaxID=2316736 RepID=UPI0030B827D6
MAAAAYHVVAARTDGSLWGWGLNFNGCLGNPATLDNLVPTPSPVVGQSGATAVAAAEGFTLALRSDGTLWGFGFNTEGQLGSGLPVYATRPIPSQLY